MPSLSADLEPKSVEDAARLGLLSCEAHTGEAGYLAEPGIHLAARSPMQYGQATGTLALRLQLVQPSIGGHKATENRRIRTRMVVIHFDR